jgi:hypothetical protein
MFQTSLDRLAQNAQSIRSLATGITGEQARWKPAPQAWSILEVVNHLYDEEQFDFRVRLDHILHMPDQEAPPIDPQGWVTSRRYNERGLEESLNNFLAERAKSLNWLRSLGEPNLDASIAMPWGSITAGDMFAAWVAHDLLHLRQLVELHYAWTQKSLAPYSLRYAGEW